MFPNQCFLDDFMHPINIIVNIKLSRAHLANKKFDIYSADCPTAWNKHPDRTSIYGPEDIEYAFNSAGFRCDEFIESLDPMVFLGCSHTMGLGIPYQETWAYKIHKQLSPNGPFWNLGFEKSSIDAQVLMLNEYVAELQPKRIFFLMPNLYRRYIGRNRW